MNVNFNGFNEGIATFIADSSVTEAGVPVKLKSNGTVEACTAGDVFCGVCVGTRGGYAAVQLSGYVRVGTSSKIGVGYKKLAAADNGKAEVNANGRELLVVDSDSTSAGIIL